MAMMTPPNIVGLKTSMDARRMTARPSASLGAWPSRVMQFSTTMTELSTTRPKSSAPRLMRLPAMPAWPMRMNAKSMARGMTKATTSPARRFPSRTIRTTTTKSPPSTRFLPTVAMVLLTRSARS